MPEYSEAVRQFLQDFELKGDGTGFWDSYSGRAPWPGGTVRVRFATRSMSDEILALYQTIITQPEAHLHRWKQFVVDELLEDIRMEAEDESITAQQIYEGLTPCDLTFGFDADGLFSVWFFKIKGCFEHTVLLYGDHEGGPLEDVVEG